MNAGPRRLHKSRADCTKVIAILHKSFVQMDMNAGPRPENCTSLAGHSLHNPLLQLIHAHEYEYCFLKFAIGAEQKDVHLIDLVKSFPISFFQ